MKIFEEPKIEKLGLRNKVITSSVEDPTVIPDPNEGPAIIIP